MNDKEQIEVFARNLRRYVSNSGKLQKDIAKDLGFSQTTFNTWCVGKIMPSLGKVQKIADYFGVGKSALLEEHPRYYFDDATAAKAQELFENRDMCILFDAARGSRPEDIQMAADLLIRLKGDVDE